MSAAAKRSRQPEATPVRSSTSLDGVGERAFLQGSIVQIKLKNFMTYDDQVLQSGPRMNFVIGPNGTGKSSLMCAIAVGLGSSTSVLGRGSKEDSFVKRGRDAAFVEIELKNNTGPNFVIRRIFQAASAATSYTLNGAPATAKDVAGLVDRLGIQIDNLCHFLAQDKDRLVHTAKAVGRKDLVEMQQSLQKQQETVDKLRQSVATDESSIDTLEKQNKDIENDRVRLMECNRKKRDANVLKVQLTAIQAKDQKEKARREREALKTIDTDLEAVNDRLKALQQPQKEQKGKLETLEKELDKAWKKLESAQKSCTSTGDRLEEVENEIEDREKDKNSLEKDVQKAQKKIQDKEKQRKDCVRKLDALKNINSAEIKERIKELSSKMEVLKKEIRTASNEEQRILSSLPELDQQESQLKVELDKLQERNRVKLQTLSRERRGGVQGTEIVEAHQWIQAHQELFEQEVFGPLLLNIELGNPQDAAMVEASIGGLRSLVAFVAQTEADKNTLLNKVYRQMHKSITVWMVPNQQFKRVQDRGTWKKLRDAGVQGTVDELFQCPEPVMQALRAQYSIHDKLYGDDKAMRDQKLVQSGILPNLVTRTQMMSSVTSRYGSRNVSTNSRALGPANFVHLCVSTRDEERRLAERMQTIREERQSRGQKRQKIAEENTVRQREMRDMKEERAGLQNRDQQKAKLEGQVQFIDEELDVQRGKLDISQQTKQLDREICKLSKSKVPHVVATVGNIKQVLESSNAKLLIEIDKKSVEQQLQRLQSDVRQAKRDKEIVEERKRNGENHVRALDREAKTTETMAKDLRKETQRTLRAQDPNAPDLEMAIEEAMRQVPEPKSPDEIENYMGKVSAEAELIFVHNPNAIKQYEERKTKLLQLRAEMEGKKSQLAAEESSLASDQSYWKSELSPIVEQIDKVFAEHMKSLEFDGAVCLQEHPSDFSMWCIDIKVRYKPGQEIRTLDSQAQSGGEKTMATIIYLTALQEQARCPFRVVDEINQGVDETNERKIFKVVSNSACEKPHVPQMFMMCQKVVTGLEYHPNITVLNIFNGPFNCTQRDLLL